MARPEKYLIDAIRALPGMARLTYPYNDLSHQKVERIYRVPFGTPPQTPGVSTDTEFTGTTLVEQAYLGSETQYSEYFCIYETLPGPLLEQSGWNDETLALEKTGTQKLLLPVSPTALSTVADVDGWIVVDSTVNPNDSITGERVTISIKLPASYTEAQSQGYQFPAKFYFIADWDIPADPPLTMTGPFPGVNYDQTIHRTATYPAVVSNTFSVSGTQPAADETWAVFSPGNASRVFPIPANTIHADIVVFEYNVDAGVAQLVEWLPESDPVSYTFGDVLTIDSNVTRWRGNIWRKRNVSVSEHAFVDTHTQWPNYPETRGATPPTPPI